MPFLGPRQKMGNGTFAENRRLALGIRALKEPLNIESRGKDRKFAPVFGGVLTHCHRAASTLEA